MPTIDERARHDLFEAVQGTLGERHADTLMSLLPPTGWTDVATKQDLHALEERIDLRFDSMEERFDARFRSIDDRFVSMEQRFDARFQAMDERFDARFQAMDERFDTRLASIEHRFDTRLESIDVQFGALQHQFKGELHRSHSSLLKATIGAYLGSLVTMTSIYITSLTLVT